VPWAGQLWRPQPSSHPGAISAQSRRNLGAIPAQSRHNLGAISAQSRRNLSAQSRRNLEMAPVALVDAVERPFLDHRLGA